MADVAKLYELQKIDTTSQKVRRRLGQLKSLLTESEDVKKARVHAASLQQEHQEWHSKQKTAELETQSLTERIAESENLLMSGQVRNPKELEALQASIEALQRQRSALETLSVEALLKTEELTGQVADARTQLQRVQEVWATNQAELTEEETKLKRAYVHLRKQREALTETTNKALIQQYEQMRERKGGVAVAAVAHENCSACNVKVASGVLSTLRSQPEKVVLCPSCGRILYAR
ncbi:MAG: C4-type zinc ribbon domain-containing protein [Caldilineaceae bacterium]